MVLDLARPCFTPYSMRGDRKGLSVRLISGEVLWKPRPRSQLVVEVVLMEILFVGLGDCGCRITDKLLSYERGLPFKSKRQGLFKGVVVNNSMELLRSLQNIPSEYKVLLNEEVVGTGPKASGNREFGKEIASDGADIVLDAVEGLYGAEIDAIMLITGLGGGYGGGAAPGVAELMVKELGGDTPIYALGVLPMEQEPDKRLRNASECLRELVRVVDNLMLVDNNKFVRREMDTEGIYTKFNSEIAKPIRMLAAGDVGVEAEYSVDTADVLEALTGKGISTVGYAESEVGGRFIPRIFRKEKEEERELSTMLADRALRYNLMLDCNPKSASGAILVMAGPPQSLRFFDAQFKIQQELGFDVVGGVVSAPRWGKIGVTILLSGITESKRLESVVKGPAQT